MGSNTGSKFYENGFTNKAYGDLALPYTHLEKVLNLFGLQELGNVKIHDKFYPCDVEKIITAIRDKQFEYHVNLKGQVGELLRGCRGCVLGVGLENAGEDFDKYLHIKHWVYVPTDTRGLGPIEPFNDGGSVTGLRYNTCEIWTHGERRDSLFEKKNYKPKYIYFLAPDYTLR